jgi:hypothetical protein
MEMVKSRSKSLAFCFLFLTLLAVPSSRGGEAPATAPSVPNYQPKFFPFEAGEKAVYRAHWSGLVSVATAEIFTTPTVVDGKKVYQVRVEAKSSRVLDWIWKMRDTITSTFDAKALVPSRFTFRQRENSKEIDTEARFHEGSQRWAVNREQKGKKPRTYEFNSPNTLDPITAVYKARAVDFNVGDSLYFKVFGGRYHYLLELRVVGKEPVQLGSGRPVQAYKIIPFVQNLTKKGYAGRLNEATIWISADERRLPIKLSSKITFGTVELELIQDKQGVQSTAAENRQPAL